jgi:hypothetical protein
MQCCLLSGMVKSEMDAIIAAETNYYTSQENVHHSFVLAVHNLKN